MNLNLFLKFVFWSIFGLRIFEATLLYSHGDPLYYHLVGARYIVEEGFLTAHRNYLPLNIGGLFDYIYVLPHLIFKHGPLTQILGQLLHFTFSIGIGSILFASLWKWKPVGVLAGIFVLTLSRSFDFFLYAKNDGALALVTLLTTLVIWKENFILGIKGKSRSMIVGIGIGFMAAIKMNGLILSCLFFLLYIYKKRKSAQDLLSTFVAAVLIASPIFIRNWYFTGTPFYPGLLTIFPGKTTPNMIEYMQLAIEKSASIKMFFLNLWMLITPKMGFVFLLFLVLYYKKYFNFEKCFIPVGYFIILLFLNGGNPAERFYFPVYFLLIYFVFDALIDIDFKNTMIIALLLVMLVDSKVDKGIRRTLSSYKTYLNSGLSSETVEKYIPYTKFWKKVPENSKVISDHASQIYYAKNGVRLFQFRTSFEADFLIPCSDPSKLEEFDFALIAWNKNNPCYELIKEKGIPLLTIQKDTLYDLSKIKE